MRLEEVKFLVLPFPLGSHLLGYLFAWILVFAPCFFFPLLFMVVFLNKAWKDG
jgi:hypothetical protein